MACKANVTYVVLSVLIFSTFLLPIVLEKQNLYALTSGDRYTSGFSHGEQQAATDFHNNSNFNPVCVKHTSYYCAGYFKGYNFTWNKGHTLNPNPHISNSTSPLACELLITILSLSLLLLFRHQQTVG